MLNRVAKFDIEMPKSLTEIVATRIRQAIIDGEFKLGQLISEESLAESFGVSRTPVRDALTQLQATGLVEIRPKRGSFVFRPTETDVIDICEFRLMLEMRAAKQSSMLNKDLLLQDLQRIFDDMQQQTGQAGMVDYGRHDTQFHQALFTHCGNGYFRAAYDIVAGKVAAMRTNLARQFADTRDTSLDEHAEMIHCIASGNFEALNKLLAVHVNRTIGSYQDAVRRQVL